jgi:predicted acyltransferase
MAVLQRIALAYLLAALIVRKLDEQKVFMLSIAILLIYWLLLYTLGTPRSQYTLEGNAVRRIDVWVLGPQHMYRERGVAFDPEGLLSTLPAVVNVLAGWLAGRWVVRKGRSSETAAKMLMAGVLMIVVAWVWQLWLPFNKKLWTSSYVVYTSAIDLLALGALFYFIEVRDWKWGVKFFSVFGKNPLFIYILSTVMGIFLVIRMGSGSIFIDWINGAFFQRVAPGAMGALLFSLCYTLICWGIGWVLDKRKIYIRL